MLPIKHTLYFLTGMTNEKTVTVSIRVKPEIRDQLAQLAKAERRTISQIVNFMIEDGLAARLKRKRGKTV